MEVGKGFCFISHVGFGGLVEWEKNIGVRSQTKTMEVCRFYL
jgi:hypothetical protein